METRQTIPILGTALILLVLLLVVFLIIPLFKAIRTSSEELVRARSDLILLEHKKQELANFERAYLDSIRSQAEELEGGLINPEVPLEFVEFLEKEARRSDLVVEISLLSLSQEKPSPLLGAIFQLSVEGPLPRILQWLDKLETSPYLIEVQNFHGRRLPEAQALAKGTAAASVTFRVLTK